MISPRWRKVLRDLSLHKLRAALVVLAITVGLLGAGTVLDAWTLVRRATRDEYRASDPPSATLRLDAADDRALSIARAFGGVAIAEARRSVVASLLGSEGIVTAALFVSEDPSTQAIGKLVPELGTWPPVDGGVVIEKSSLAFANLAVGDSVTLRVGDGPARRLPITGVVRDVGLAPGWMDHVVYAFVTPTTLASLGEPVTPDELRIVARDRTLDRRRIRQLAFALKSALERSGRVVRAVDVPEPGKHVHAAQLESLLFTQLAFGALALLLSGFLVLNLISAMLTGQVREIGTMKALGARPGQLVRMYLGLAFGLGLVASVLAIPLAAVIGHAYAQFTADLLNFSVKGLTIPPAIIFAQLAVGTLLPVVAAGMPVLRGTRMSVADALRDVGIVATAGSRGFAARRTGFSRPLLLSLRNTFRQRQRTVFTLIALATGGAVYIGALNLRAAIIDSVDLLFAAQRYDLVVRVTRPASAASIEGAIRTVAGVTAVEAWAGARASLRHEDGTLGDAFVITAPPAGSSLLVPDVRSGRWLAAGDQRALVVNRSLLDDEPTLHLGAVVPLLVAGSISQWTVVGVAEGGLVPQAYAEREPVAGLVHGGLVDLAVVRVSGAGARVPLAYVSQFRSELASRGFEVRGTQLTSENRRAVEDHMLMVAGFLGVMAQLMIVMGGLGLAASMSLAVLERTREIGVLKAIGARHRDIMLMVQTEGAALATLSWLAAIPLSVPMSVFIGQAFGRIMIPVPLRYVPQGAPVFQWLGVVLGVSLVACAWPAIRATRISTRAALSYE